MKCGRSRFTALKRRDETYNLIFLDPPALAKSRAQVQKAVQEISSGSGSSLPPQAESVNAPAARTARNAAPLRVVVKVWLLLWLGIDTDPHE